VALVNDQDPVEQFATQRFDYPLTARVGPGCSGRAGEDLVAVCGEDRVERSGESGVVISEQEGDAGGAVGEGLLAGCGRLEWVHAPVGCAVTPSRCARRQPCSPAISAEIRLSNTVSPCTKSTASMALAWW
jgi:hypothetical protein